MKKKLPKILIYFFTIIFILQIISVIFLFFIPNPSNAADIKFTPQVGIPNDPNFGPGKTLNFSSSDSTKPIADYIIAFYKYGIGIVGILATVVMMIGGIIWLTAGGSPEKINEAQSWIKSAITGLALALGSYLILATVNTDLVNFKITKIGTVTELNSKKESVNICQDNIGRKGYYDASGKCQMCKNIGTTCTNNSECCNNGCDSITKKCSAGATGAITSCSKQDKTGSLTVELIPSNSPTLIEAERRCKLPKSDPQSLCKSYNGSIGGNNSSSYPAGPDKYCCFCQ